MILGIDHVGIAVTSAADAGAGFSTLTGTPATAVEPFESLHVRLCFVPTAGAQLELLEPLDGQSAVARFLERRGEGLHHVCFAVDDIRAEAARLAAAGYQLLDAAPRPGHGGMVVFLHPRSASGVLVELLQRDHPR